MDFRDTKEDEERDIAIVQKKWDKLETIATGLSEAIEDFLGIVSTSEDGTEISGDPSTIIATSNKEAKEAHKEYLEKK